MLHTLPSGLYFELFCLDEYLLEQRMVTVIWETLSSATHKLHSSCRWHVAYSTWMACFHLICNQLTIRQYSTCVSTNVSKTCTSTYHSTRLSKMFSTFRQLQVVCKHFLQTIWYGYANYNYMTLLHGLVYFV